MNLGLLLCKIGLHDWEAVYDYGFLGEWGHTHLLYYRCRRCGKIKPKGG